MIKWILILGLIIHVNIWAQCGAEFQGEGTFYGYAGGGNCSFPDPELPAMTGAMNQMQYDSSVICGACVEVTGPRGTLNIRIEDRCPECAYGDIDLAEDAFPLIADPVDGRVSIRWKIIPCPVVGAVQFYIKEGSSQWWTAVQVRNAKYPVQSLEIEQNGEWIQVQRMMYNYFLNDDGMGPGPYTFRVTDIYGHSIVETGIPLEVTTVIQGQNQFESCPDENVNMQVFDLHAGSNLVTLYLEQENMSVQEIFPHALIVKNQNKYYNSEQVYFLNSFTELEIFKPYEVINSQNEQLTISGNIAEPQSEIPLTQGWNMLAYPFSEMELIEPILSPLADTVIVIRNENGFWKPNIYNSTIEYFMPGNAYFINVSDNCVLHW